MKSSSVSQDNYVTKMRQMWQSGALPREVGVHMVDVAHDAWCGIFEYKRCNCDPDITVKWSQPAAAQN
jgi:hypothetical protein